MTTALIVDDSPTVRKLLRRTMERLGFAVREAGDGSEALTSVDEVAPDVILLDWNMPVMDGLTFLRELRTRAFAQPPRVIFCTSMNDLAHIQEALAAGADEYVMKPFDEDIIRDKLEQVGAL